MDLISIGSPSVFGRVKNVISKRDGDRQIWAYEIDDQRIFVADPKIAAALGGTAKELTATPVILEVRETDVVKLATGFRFPGNEHRLLRATDMSSGEFIYNFGLADAFDGALEAYCTLVESDIPRNKLFTRAETYFRKWLERSHLEDEQDWSSELLAAVRHIRDAAEDGRKGDFDGSVRTKELCNTALNVLGAAERARGSSTGSEGAPRYVGRSNAGMLLGSHVTSQFHDFGSVFSDRSALFSAKSALICMERSLGKEFVSDKQIVREALERAEKAESSSDCRRELCLALSWSWYAFHRRQQQKHLKRHEGPLGRVVANLETAVQWAGGRIPDRGPFEGIDVAAKASQEHDLSLALAFQRARKSPDVRGGTENGKTVWACSGGEQIVSDAAEGTRVIDTDGTVLFQRGPARSHSKISGLLDAFSVRKRDRGGEGPSAPKL